MKAIRITLTLIACIGILICLFALFTNNRPSKLVGGGITVLVVLGQICLRYIEKKKNKGIESPGQGNDSAS